MKVLSVDPGYGRLGIAVIEKGTRGKDTLLYSSCLETPKTDPYEKRLLCVGEEIERVINKYSPDVFASESLFFAKNQKTAISVAGARGVLLYTAKQHDLPIFEYTPLQIKIAVTGYGRGDKKQVTEMVVRLIDTNKEILLDDEYDAIAVGLTCIASEKFKK